jgi:hypothetical protein
MALPSLQGIIALPPSSIAMSHGDRSWLHGFREVLAMRDKSTTLVLLAALAWALAGCAANSTTAANAANGDKQQVNRGIMVDMGGGGGGGGGGGY